MNYDDDDDDDDDDTSCTTSSDVVKDFRFEDKDKD